MFLRAKSETNSNSQATDFLIALYRYAGAPSVSSYRTYLPRSSAHRASKTWPATRRVK